MISLLSHIIQYIHKPEGLKHNHTIQPQVTTLNYVAHD